MTQSVSQSVSLPGGWCWISENSDDKGHSGIGVLIDKRLSAEYLSCNTLVPHRVQLLKFAQFDVVNVYSFHSATPDHELLFEKLAGIQCSNSKPTFFVGDFNAEIDSSSRASSLLSSFLEARSLRSAAASLSRSCWTWTSPSKTTTKAIDHIFVEKRYVASCTKVRFTTPPAFSDHRMVVCDFSRRFKTVAARPAQPPRPDYDALAYDPSLRQRFDVQFRQTEMVHPTSYVDFLRSVKLASSILPSRAASPRLSPAWSSPSVAMWDVRASNNPNPDHVFTFLSRIDDFTSEQSTAHISRYAELLSLKPWVAWKHVFAVRRDSLSSSSALGKAQFSTHFRALMESSPALDVPPLTLPAPPAVPPLPLSAEIFSQLELDTAVASMSNHRASGPDDLPIEVCRCPSVRAALLPVVNHIFLHPEESSQLLLDAFLTPIYKRKGDKADVKNYRPVVLLSQVLKILDKMILLRMRASLSPSMMIMQNAYLPRRSTIQHILTMQQLSMYSTKCRDLPLFGIFVDFNRAFDSVIRSRLSSVLRYFSVPERFITFIEHSLRHQRLFTRASDGVDETHITPTEGVMQGDTLAPFLFILVIDVCLRSLPLSCGARVSNAPLLNKRSSSDTALRIQALAFSDDLLLLSNDVFSLQHLFSELEKATLQFGLTINLALGKTELMRFGTDIEVDIRTMKGESIRIVNTYKYLGWKCTSACAWRDDFRNRVKQSWFILKSYDRVWKSSASSDAKRKLFYALIVPILSYAAFSYPQTQTCRRELHTSCNSLLRYALNVKIEYDDQPLHMHTESLYGTMPTLPTVVAYHYLSSYGHWVRDTFVRNVIHPLVNILSERMKETMKRTGSRHTPQFNLEVLSQLSPEDATALALDRSKWKRLCCNIAVDVERQMYNNWILPRRLGGVTVTEHSQVLSDRTVNVKRWLAHHEVPD